VLLRPATPSDLPRLLEIQRGGAVRTLAHVFPQDLYPIPIEGLSLTGLGLECQPNAAAPAREALLE
jgi:hypothetical protein